MFVLLAIPIVGGFIAGRFMRSARAAMVVAGVLWAVAGVWMIVNRADDPKNEFNVTFWIGLAFGVIGFASARLGHRMRDAGA